MAQSRRFFWWPRRISYGIIGGYGGVRVKKIVLGGPEESYRVLPGVPVKKILLGEPEEFYRGYTGGYRVGPVKKILLVAQKNLIRDCRGL